MEGWGIAIWIILAAVIGSGADVAVTSATKRGSRATAVAGFLAALLGAFAWSEWFGQASDWGPSLQGLNLLPAFLGATILSAVQILSTRLPRAAAVEERAAQAEPEKKAA